MSDAESTVSCVNCGDEVSESDAVYNSGSVNEDGAERLMEGETVSADELFGFDEPYCSWGCLMEVNDE